MKVVLLFAALLFAHQSLADWTLDSKHSKLSFVSVKNGIIAEVHTFKSLSGGIDDNALASLSIDLDSVDTLIPIRDERMRKMLFDTSKFPAAEVAVQLDADTLRSLAGSSGTSAEVFGNLTIRGKTQRIAAAVLVSATQDGGVVVSTEKPILISANQFDLLGGLEALREIAGLASITPVSPVTFSLTFKPAKAKTSNQQFTDKNGEVVF